MIETPMLKLIQELFAIERRAKEAREAPDSPFGDAEHLELRRTESAPLVEEIRACGDAWSTEVLPRSTAGQESTTTPQLCASPRMTPSPSRWR